MYTLATPVFMCTVYCIVNICCWWYLMQTTCGQLSRIHIRYDFLFYFATFLYVQCASFHILFHFHHHFPITFVFLLKLFPRIRISTFPSTWQRKSMSVIIKNIFSIDTRTYICNYRLKYIPHLAEWKYTIQVRFCLQGNGNWTFQQNEKKQTNNHKGI